MGAAVQPTSAWEQWRAATDRIDGGFETRLSGPTSAFRGSIQRYCVLGLNYTSLETNARSLVRGKLGSSVGNHYCLVYQARGRSLARQGKSIAIKPVKTHGAPATINLDELWVTSNLADNMDPSGWNGWKVTVMRKAGAGAVDNCLDVEVRALCVEGQ